MRLSRRTGRGRAVQGTAAKWPPRNRRRRARLCRPGWSPLTEPGAPGRRCRRDFHRRDRDRFIAMSWIEITELVKRAQAGERGAFGELVERFQGAVYATALARLRDPVEAQEMAQ